jgi:hypothetical protein
VATVIGCQHINTIKKNEKTEKKSVNKSNFRSIACPSARCLPSGERATPLYAFLQPLYF